MHPKFICIGAQKAGTDWVYDQFAAHRDFWMPPIKEIAYFDRSYGGPRLTKARRQLEWMMRYHGKGKGDYTYDIAFLLRMLHGNPRPWTFDFSDYFGLFENKPGLSGDCTPGYCHLKEEMAQAMYDKMPQTAFLLMVRDPVERLWSQVLMHDRLARNPEMDLTGSFRDFKSFTQRRGVRRLSYLSRTIRLWRKIDTQGRFRVFQFDDLKVDAEAYRRSVAEHVGADPEGFSIAADFNKKAGQPGKQKIPEAFRAHLAEVMADEYRALEELIGGHAVTWRERNEAFLQAA